MSTEENMGHSRTATRANLLPALVLAISWLGGCAHVPQSLIPVDDAQVNDPSHLARLNENSKHPLLLRGIDQKPLETLRTPGTSGDYDYVMQAGRHTLWVMSVPYGHPLIPQRIRCYVIEVELTGGTRYRLEEDRSQKLALVLRADTGERIASGQRVDEAWVFSRQCRWQ